MKLDGCSRANDGSEEEQPTRPNKHRKHIPSEPIKKASAKRRAAGPRHLFAAWKEVAARLHRADYLALLLDFDGTLAALRPRPEQAQLPEPARRSLGRLARQGRVFVIIVSGRTLVDIRRRAGIAGALYRGVYGLERESGMPPVNKRVMRRIESAKTAVRAALRGLPSVWIEDKGLSFAVHFRGAGRATVRRAGRVFHRVLAPFLPWLQVLSGKKVWEVLPRTFRGKGATVNTLLAALPESTLAIYVGDDAADESAFRALRRGITVRVGHSLHTGARFRLRNPEEVLRFLKRLEGELLCGRKNHSASTRLHT